ncbi:MAG TPA: hypothetical protein EYG94_05680 [Campylobacterales bacterium]|nr:hypothetical protein [Sulfurospirillum arcachonense]HIP51565.1 hypothetical protein [Campylobacterales bacterium]
MRKLTVVITLLVILALLNFAIFKREKHIENGAVVFLPLAPVDPRSLMQGDYMALNFAMSRDIHKALPKVEHHRYFWRKEVDGNDGFVLVNLNEKRVATFSSIYKNETLKKDQMLLQYRVRAGEVKFATNAFFFEEGTGSSYDKAKFGEFRVNKKHELLLVDMYDENLTKIEPLT